GQQGPVLFGDKETGAKRVYTKILAKLQRQLPCHIFSEICDSRFCRTISGNTRERTQRRSRRYIDNITSLLSHHVPCKNNCRNNSTHQVEIHHLTKIVHLQVEDRVLWPDGCPGHVSPCSIDQHINFSVRAYDLLRVLFQNRLVGHIGLKEQGLPSF